MLETHVREVKFWGQFGPDGHYRSNFIASATSCYALYIAIILHSPIAFLIAICSYWPYNDFFGALRAYKLPRGRFKGASLSLEILIIYLKDCFRGGGRRVIFRFLIRTNPPLSFFSSFSSSSSFSISLKILIGSSPVRFKVFTIFRLPAVVFEIIFNLIRRSRFFGWRYMSFNWLLSLLIRALITS
jgi:hypothetical protein